MCESNQQKTDIVVRIVEDLCIIEKSLKVWKEGCEKITNKCPIIDDIVRLLRICGLEKLTQVDLLKLKERYKIKRQLALKVMTFG